MWLSMYFPFYTPSTSVKKKLSGMENMIEYQNTFFNLLNLVMSSFKFTGLPDTCNERFLKLSLIFSGAALMAKDPEKGFINLYTSSAGADWNLYGEPSKVNGYGWNGWMKEYINYMYGSDNSKAQAIICRDNPTCYPMVNYLFIASQRLSQTMRTIDVTAGKLKTPYFIVCDESQKTSIKKILQDIDFNQDSIITNKSTTPDMFKVLSTNVRSEALQSLWNHYQNVDAQVRTVLGIKSAVNQDKAERLLVDEVNANDDLKNLNIGTRIESYKLFCKTVNEFWGLNIGVEHTEYGLESTETPEGMDEPDPMEGRAESDDIRDGV